MKTKQYHSCWLRLLSGVPIGALLLVTTFGLLDRASAQPCFMVTPSGSSLDLSRLCGDNNTPKSQPSAQPQAIQANSFQTRIKRRQAGIPVIEVTFNGSQTYEMLLDTGASRTLITRSMAEALQVVPTGTVRVSTASATNVQFFVGTVRSIAVGGVSINNVDVIVGGPEQDIGLLGHDFFGDYEITIRRDMVIFRRS